MNSSLYIHVPFCKRLCGYCDFYKTMSLAHKEDYLHAAAAEMERRRSELNGTALRTVYFGGGTPSVLTPTEIGSLLNFARRLWDFGQVDEITVESNPDDLTTEYLDALASTGCNRLSIGIQSFVDRDLQFMNRRHDAAQAVRAVENARAAGFRNISIDLIYGLPEMSIDEWRTNIAMAVDLGVEHISAYHLTVEPQTLFGRKGIKTVDEAIGEEEYLMLHEALVAAGYDHYEISNFARSGYRSVHNSAYWKGLPYLGIGPSAHSYDGERRRSWNPSSIEKYLSGAAAESETLTDTQLAEEYIMVHLRTSGGIDTADYAVRFGGAALCHLQQKMQRFIADGSLQELDGRVRFNPLRWLISDSVIADLFD